MKKSLLKCINSFRFAARGILYSFAHENNIRYHALATLLVIIAGFTIKMSYWEWIAITISIGMVWMAELFNTAIEKLVDLISPEFNEKAGTVKDIAAGAVLIATITSVVVAVMVFWFHYYS